MIAPAGHTYYINDGSKTGDVYTTAVGSDANSGKTPDAPMASLASLLSFYHLQPGDTVYIDSGTYNLSSDLKSRPKFCRYPGNPIQIIGAGATTILARSGTALSTERHPHQRRPRHQHRKLGDDRRSGRHRYR